MTCRNLGLTMAWIICLHLHVCARVWKKKCMHRVQVYECLFLLLLSYFEYLHADHCTSLSFISPRDFSANFTCYSLHLASWALHTVTAPWPALQKQNKNRGFQTALKNKSTDTRHCIKRPVYVLHLWVYSVFARVRACIFTLIWWLQITWLLNPNSSHSPQRSLPVKYGFCASLPTGCAWTPLHERKGQREVKQRAGQRSDKL